MHIKIGTTGYQKLFSNIPKLAIERGALGARIALKGLGLAVTGMATFDALYRHYLLAIAAFEAVSKYSGQYAEKKDGHVQVAETPKELSRYFCKISENSWNILEYNFDQNNLKDVQGLLSAIYQHVDEPMHFNGMVAQVLTMLYVGYNGHFIIKGSEIEIPVMDGSGKKHLVKYTLDQKFNLWENIPAFGFIDPTGKHAPLLIFKSTNTKIEEIDTFPTLVANLNPKGPGWKLYSSSNAEVTRWLEAQNAQSQEKARVLGYSLGGTLAAYFLVYHPELFSKYNSEEDCTTPDNNPWNRSYILNAPGVNNSIGQNWEKLESKPNVSNIINHGDLIPKIGDFLIGDCFEIRIGQNLHGFDSHRALSFFAPQWKLVEISSHCEKKSKTRSLLNDARHLAGAVIYRPAKNILLPCLKKIFY